MTPSNPTVKRLLALALAGALAANMLIGCTAFKEIGYGEGAEGSSANGTPPEARYCPAPYPEPCPDPYLFDGPGNTEEYSHIEEPGFVSTATRPFSTFSADVDTASYCNLRRMVAEGTRIGDIPRGAIRIEEMLNYFDYDYAAPRQNDLFGVTSQIADCPWNPDTKLLVMGFATEPIDYADTAGANLVFLIDTSGSMDSPDKLPLLQDSFAELTDGLTERDRVSIVTYAGTERVVLEGASGADKRAITRAVDSLRAEGSTNGEAGLETAYRIADRYRIEGGVNRIIMASDGDLNVGMSSESDLRDYVSEKRTGGVYLSVLGFGSGNYKDNKMEALADNGNGTYCYIDCREEARRVFDEKLAANIVPLADDAKLQVEFNPSQVKGYRLIGYENRSLADRDFENDAVDAGEIGTGHQFTIAYEIALADSAIDIPTPEPDHRSDGADEPDDAGSAGKAPDRDSWLTCSIRYKPAGAAVSTARSYEIGEESFTARPNDDWAFAAAVIECGMVLRGSDHAGSASLREARAMVAGLDIAAHDVKADFERMLTVL